MRAMNATLLDKTKLEQVLVYDPLYNSVPQYTCEKEFNHLMIFNGSGWNLENLPADKTIIIPLFDIKITKDHFKQAFEILDIVPYWKCLLEDPVMKKVVHETSEHIYALPYSDELGVVCYNAQQQEGCFFLIENIMRIKKEVI